MSATSDEDSIQFYDTHYDILREWHLKPGDKVVLGDKQNRVCRFCGRCSPAVKFNKVAHAIPEALGNKSIESTYECDECNESFGGGIENDLGNWTKPSRTFARIRGKNGVPTLKKGGEGQGWRIEYVDAGFNITSYEADPVFQLDEDRRRITFQLKRDPFVPVAVLKAFMKIGLTLIPDDEVENFPELMSWVTATDHSRLFAEKCPMIRTFQPGPMPNDLITVFLLRRKALVMDYPYMFLVLAYGNEVFQVQMPSKKHDSALNGRVVTLCPFPAPGSPDATRGGPPKVHVLDLTGRERVKGEIVSVELGYDFAVRQPGPAGAMSE